MGAQLHHKGMFLKHGVGGGQKFSNSVMGGGTIFSPHICEGGALFFSPIDFANPPHPPHHPPAINNEHSLIYNNVIIRALPLLTKCTVCVLAVFRLGFPHLITCYILPLTKHADFGFCVQTVEHFISWLIWTPNI